MVEATIPEMRTALEQKQITSHQLVMLYLARIAMYENKLHATITVNPHVLQEADERDRERAEGQIRGPLHGIPIALKDNVLTHDIVTTGGALAFQGLSAAVRCDAGEESARRRRDHHRQDDAVGAGELGGRRADADARQLQCGSRIRLQSLRSAARSAAGHR